ncbi:hypothetical protein ACIPSH_25480 [Streptomyces iakyrus]|uniref:hypothetical protein n=1 Tax=Streptomyces iakyrus TaxID=68219 RepID=UPI003811C96A
MPAGIPVRASHPFRAAGTCPPPSWERGPGKDGAAGAAGRAVDDTGNGEAVRPEQEKSAPQVVSEPDPPYESDKQQRPGLEAAMRTEPRYRARRCRVSGKPAGKTTLITGGDSGIGRAVALLYARECAYVAVVHLPEEREERSACTPRWRSRAGAVCCCPATSPTRSSAVRRSNGRRRNSAG